MRPLGVGPCTSWHTTGLAVETGVVVLQRGPGEAAWQFVSIEYRDVVSGTVNQAEVTVNCVAEFELMILD